MTDTHDQPDRRDSAPSAPLEKVPLETYVPPAKPSLIGLSRAEIADRLGEIGVAPAQRKMRAQQLWHWIYVRGARSFRRDDQRLQGDARRARAAFHGRPPRGGRRADLQRRHPQMAAAPAERRQARAAARGRVRLHPRDRPRHAVRLLPGRLHAELLVLPHRHAAAGAQPHRRRDRRPGHGGARPARRLGRPRDPTAAASSPTS